MIYMYHAHLGMTWVVSDQFPCIENIRRNAMAKRDRKEPKERHIHTCIYSSTKGELGYTLIATMHT